MNITESIIEYVRAVFIVIGIIGFFFFNDYKGDIQFAFEIPIGLLAFVGIFYPLIFRRELKKRRDEILSFRWSELKNFINSKTREINNIMRKEKNISLASQALSEISERIGIFEDKSNVLKVERHVKYAIAFSFITIVLSIFMLPLPQPYLFYGELSWNTILIWALIAAIYYSVKVVIAWHKIHESKI